MEKTMIDENDLNIPEKRRKIVVSVVGCERLGLVTACLLAEAGFKVFCVHPDQSIVNQVTKGLSPFPHLELESLLARNVSESRLAATTDTRNAVTNSDIILLHVPPEIDEKKKPDYSSLEKVCRDVGLNLHPGVLIILESDVAPGTTETLVKETLETASGLKAGNGFALAYCSTQVTSGTGLQDVVKYSKVFGAIDEKSSDLTEAFLRTLTKGEVVQMSNMKTAEAIKLFQCIYQDANTALANELAYFCERAGIDFAEVRKVVNLRSLCHLPTPDIVGRHISDDSYLLIDEAENLRIKLHAAMLARKINDAFLNHVFHLVKDAIRSSGRSARRSRILILGVSRRPNVKEFEDSFIKELIELLRNKGMLVKVYDPLFSYKELTDLGYPAERTLTNAVKGMDCLLIAAGHERFRRLNFRRIGLLMRKPSSIVDISYVVDASEAERKGFTYRGLGRGLWTR